MRERTHDTLADLRLWQYREGFRFGLDAILLATALPVRAQKIADLGAGHGAVSLAVARQFPEAEVLAIERQPSLWELLAENISLNGFDDRVTPLLSDLRDLRRTHSRSAQSYDLVVSNPPFYRIGEGRQSHVVERREAHQELHGTLGDFLEAGRWLLRPRGFFKLVLPPARLPEVMQTCAECDLGLVSLRFVHARAGQDAYLMEVVLRRDHKGVLVIHPPMVLHEGDAFTPEIQKRLELA